MQITINFTVCIVKSTSILCLVTEKLYFVGRDHQFIAVFLNLFGPWTIFLKKYPVVHFAMLTPHEQLVKHKEPKNCLT